MRRLARELGVDLRRVRPRGEGGRITEDDVRAHVRHDARAGSRRPARRHAPGRPSSDGQGAVRVEKMSRMRQTIARNMIASYTTIPQLTNFDDVDVTELEEMRQQSKEDYAKRGLQALADAVPDQGDRQQPQRPSDRQRLGRYGGGQRSSTRST